MALVPPIKKGDFVSIRQAIQKLASIKLGPTSTPTFAAISVTGEASVSTFNAINAVINSLTVTSVIGLANCIAVSSLPSGNNYELVFHIPDVHFYVYG